MGNGLSNIQLDPEKVNRFLLGSPLKLVSGSLSEIKLSIEITNQRIAVTVGTLNLIMYVDSSSQYEYFRQDRDTMKVVESSEDDMEGVSASEDGTPTLIDKIISSFEVDLQWKAVNLEVQLGNVAIENAKFFVSIGGISVKKFKKRTELVIHQLVASIGTLTAWFTRAHETRKEKMLSLNVITREGEAVLTKNALEVGIDIMKEVSSTSTALSSVSRFTVVRANMGALQGILTLQSALELVRLIEKVIAYSHRNMLMQRELLRFVRSWHGDKVGTEEDFRDAEFNDELFKSCIGNPLLASFAKVGSLQDPLLNSMRYTASGSGTTEQIGAVSLTESFVSRQHLAAEIAKQALTKEMEETLQKGAIEIEANVQGIYVAFLKVPTFETSEVFTWPTKAVQDEIHFREVLSNHFMLYAEKIQLQYLSKSREGKRLILSSLGLKDIIKKKDTVPDNPANNSFLQRVDIQGLDERSHSGVSSLYNSLNENSNIQSDEQEDSFEFKSVLEPSQLVHYKVVDILKFERIVQIKREDPLAVIFVNFNLDKEVPEIAVKINTVTLNIELDSFTLLSNRQEFANLLVASTERVKKHSLPSLEQYGYIMESEVNEILADLNFMLGQVGDDFWRRELLKLFQIPDPKLITTEKSPKVTVDINKIVLRAGGVIDAFKNQSVWANLELGSLSVILQKQIIVSWRHTLDLYLQHSEKRAKVLSIRVSKEGGSENLVAIDEECLVTKITGIDIYLSPEIFEGMLLLIDLSNHKLKKLDYSQEKFKLGDAIAELKKVQAQSEVKYNQELLINEVCSKIMLKLTEVPPLVSNLYIFVGCVSLYLHDQDITQEILTSLRLQRKKRKDDVWETVDADGTSTIIESGETIEADDKRESRLQEMNVVIQLDIRPIMIKMNNKGDMSLLIHTILLRDGMTALSMAELKDKYKTHFCELYSINYKQPMYDAKLASEKYRVSDALKKFKMVRNEYAMKGPFVVLDIVSDPHNGDRKNISVKMSSLVFRLGFGTARETFLCLIKIVDKTISKLNSIKDLLKVLQQTHETEDMRDFRKKREQSVLSSTMSKPAETPKVPHHQDHITVELDTISLDVFNEGLYRLILNINKTQVHIGSAAIEYMGKFAGKPKITDPIAEMAIDIEDVRVLYRDDYEYTMKRSVDSRLLEEYYRLLSLPQAQILMLSKEQEGIPIKLTNVYLHSVKDQKTEKTEKSALLILDTLSISVLLQIADNLDRLLKSAQGRTKYFLANREDCTEISVEPEHIEEEEDEFVVVGDKAPELTQVDRMLSELPAKLSAKQNDDGFENLAPDREVQATENPKRVQTVNKLFADTKRVIDCCHVDGLRKGRQVSITNINLDKLTLELVQRYNASERSSLSLQLKKVLCVLQTESSHEDDKKKEGQRYRDTNSAVLCIQSFSIRDNTLGGKFKYLVKIPKHSLTCFFRSRVTSHKYPKPQDELELMIEGPGVSRGSDGEPIYIATTVVESSLSSHSRVN